MINFEEELKRYQPMPGVNQAEEAIYNNDIRDISDIVTQITAEFRNNNDNNMMGYPNNVRR